MTVNYSVNPYNIFSHSYEGDYNFFKPYALSDRMSKFYEAKHLNPATLMMGTSRIGFFSSSYLEPYAPHPIYNLALAGSSIYEQTRYLEYMIEHQKIKMIVWGIDFFPFNPDKKNEDTFQDARLDHYIYLDDYITSLLAYRTFEKSIQTVKINYKNSYDKKLSRPLFEEAQYFDFNNEPKTRTEIKKNIQDTLNEYKSLPGFLKSSHFSNPHSIDPGLFRLKHIVDLCREKKITCIIYTSPVSAEHLNLIYSLGLGNTFDYWKKSLADIQSYYDFCTYNSITNNIMNFRDSSHIIKEDGQLIFAKIFKNPTVFVPEDFGYTVTAENINQHLKQQRKLYYESTF